MEREQELAVKYRTSGRDVGDVCAHNATVAANSGADQLAHAWQALHFILDTTLASAAQGGTDLGGDATVPVGLSLDGGLDTSMDAWAKQILLESVTPVIESLLRHHAERGDAQTCAVMARTLMPVLPKLAPKALVYRWTLGYVEILQRLQRFELANGVIKSSSDERVQQLNQRSTTINVGGGGSSSSLGRPARATCSVCQLPVRGLYAWCQGCGHGGHAQHMRDWFLQSAECPAGCGHRCQLRTLEPPWTQAMRCEELPIDPTTGAPLHTPGAHLRPQQGRQRTTAGQDGPGDSSTDMSSAEVLAEVYSMVGIAEHLANA